jgi:hypothetical protein
VSAISIAFCGTSSSSHDNERPHRGIDLELPVAYSSVREFTSVDGVERSDRLGGLLHEHRVAA